MRTGVRAGTRTSLVELEAPFNKIVTTDELMLCNVAGAAAEVARAISPSAPKVDHSGEEEAAFVSPSQSENPRARKGRFMYLATSTKTETVYKITATTAVTFICTPKSSILNMCP